MSKRYAPPFPELVYEKHIKSTLYQMGKKGKRTESFPSRQKQENKRNMDLIGNHL
jgi:hypothetical protein